ncbi:hypothetical protein H2200_002200 [Cladophialophora chaetospira]|uniref:Uncharacterized protein n=1 Tax=Cladophialophora chaetospira TaxID=386627 RepID=A0AA39CMU4_9EURO|nr:hypothetical protein H2200_002200 [Cladophialophora chaetospira]
MRRRYSWRHKTIESPPREDHDDGEAQDEAGSGAPSGVRASSPPPEAATSLLESPSDPFDAMGFKITPEMTRIIHIAQTSFLPSLYVYPYIKRLSRRFPPTANPSCTGEQLADGNVGLGFSFGGCTSAWICDHITSLLRFHDGQQKRELERAALQLKHHSLGSLRDKMLQLPELAGAAGMDLMVHVMWLHGVESMARNYDAAKAHARALSVILDSHKERPEMISLMIIMQFNDVELCTRAMRRTTMDFESSFGKALDVFMQEHAALIPQPLENDETLHPCLASSAFLRPICARLRHFLVLSDSPEPIEAPKDPSSGKVLWIWISSMTQQDTGRLLNRFLDLTELRNKQNPKSSWGLRYTEACLTITMLHLLRKYFHESPMRGVDLRDGSQSIMKRLRYYLKLAIKHSTLADVTYHREAFLWMFFAGAQYETRLKSDQKIEFEERDANNIKTSDASTSWFSMMLAEQAKALGATIWPEARKILQQFLYTDYFEPHGEKWFEATVSAYARPGNLKCNEVSREYWT